jgi:endogenous inhibitor of DNA gyrase (YacG/DUF329 family)
MSASTVTCPYCQAETTVTQTDDYAPQFHPCPSCGRNFIAERHAGGLRVMRIKDAPCMSNPDCREVETSATCEE